MGIETIEHAQNIGALLDGVSTRLRPGGVLFVQSLLHQTCSYLMDSSSWFGRNFFSGGSILSLNPDGTATIVYDDGEEWTARLSEIYVLQGELEEQHAAQPAELTPAMEPAVTAAAVAPAADRAR